MKHFTAFIFMALLSSYTLACEENAKALLDPKELYLFNKHPAMAKAFLDCGSPSFGLDTVVHEAVHMEDFGVPSFKTIEEVEQWFEKNKNPRLNFFTLDEKYLPEMSVTRLPSPNKLINRFLKENYPEILEEETSTILTFVEMYIDDLKTAYANSFTQGFSELNAYAHGLKTEHRLKNDLKSRYGVLAFTFFLKAYLHQLKKESPGKFKILLKDKNRKFISTFLKQSSDILIETNYCLEMDGYEKRDLSPILADEKHLGALREVVLNQDDVDSILCR